MNVLHTVLEHDVFPAVGCTEPIAVAYAASAAGKQLEGDVSEIHISVDPGVYKNGFAVTIPNTGGERGNLIAGVLGALIKCPELKMEIMSCVTDDILSLAKALVESKRADIRCDKSKGHLFIEAFLRSEKDSARAVVEYAHSNLVKLEHNGRELFQSSELLSCASEDEYRAALRGASIAELVDMSDRSTGLQLHQTRESI